MLSTHFPLNYAAIGGHSEIVEILLKNGAFSNPKDANGKWTPLHIAASNGFPKLVEILLKHGAKKEMLDKWNRTPLKLAEQYERRDFSGVIGLLK